MNSNQKKLLLLTELKRHPSGSGTGRICAAVSKEIDEQEARAILDDLVLKGFAKMPNDLIHGYAITQQGSEFLDSGAWEADDAKRLAESEANRLDVTRQNRINIVLIICTIITTIISIFSLIIAYKN